jgi:hypothetical protein
MGEAMVYDRRAADPLGFHLEGARAALDRAQNEPRYGFVRNSFKHDAIDGLQEALYAAALRRLPAEAIVELGALIAQARNLAAAFLCPDAELDHLARGIENFQRALEAFDEVRAITAAAVEAPLRASEIPTENPGDPNTWGGDPAEFRCLGTR